MPSASSAPTLVVLTMAEDGSEWQLTYDAVRALVSSEVAVVPTVLRPRPMTSVRGRRVAYFCTARPDAHEVIAAHLETAHGADVVRVSGNLADRSALQKELAEISADVFLVELKAAAVDLVAEFGLSQGVEIVLAANDVVPLPGHPDLDEIVLEMSRIEV